MATDKFITMTKEEVLKKFRWFRDAFFPMPLLKTINDHYQLHHDTPAWNTKRQTRAPDIEELVNLLTVQKSVGHQTRLIADQDIELQCFLWERFYYFEKYLQDIPDGEDPAFPADFGDFLKEVLLYSWRLREQRGWFE